MKETLKSWLGNNIYNLNEKELAKLEKHLDVPVLKEFVCQEKGWISWTKVGTSHKNVFNYVVLENKLAVAWNENPSIGFSFPSKKVSEEVYQNICGKKKSS